CLKSLWERESGWRYNASNPYSGAYGIPQALPGSKMASAGADWRTNPETQIIWGLGYIAGRYSTPCGAWSFFQSHNWY
ncbi:MAG: lytic transglycosylase domain-containing protein, partial [Propionibacteriaceae bacterium]|nr:lytic transglycosylase domain-containing protein [Propionibacteriaceae bacterium]